MPVSRFAIWTACRPRLIRRFLACAFGFPRLADVCVVLPLVGCGSAAAVSGRSRPAVVNASTSIASARTALSKARVGSRVILEFLRPTTLAGRTRNAPAGQPPVFRFRNIIARRRLNRVTQKGYLAPRQTTTATAAPQRTQSVDHVRSNPPAAPGQANETTPR